MLLSVINFLDRRWLWNEAVIMLPYVMGIETRI